MGDKNSSVNPWYYVGAGVVGFIGAVVVTITEIVRQRQNNAYRRDTAEKVAKMEEELATLQKLVKEKNVPNCRKLRSPTLSVTATEDYCTALDGDDSYLEDNDTSSDDDSNFSRIQRDLTDIDLKLQDETSSDIHFALEKLYELKEEYPYNCEVLCRIAEAHKILACQTKDNEEKLKHITKGVKACEDAIHLNSRMACSHKWMAMLIGLRSEFVSVKQRMLDAKIFKKHVYIAKSLTPCDPLLYHMLGRFAYEIAQLTWIERTTAKCFFDEELDMSYQDALNHFIKAESLSEKDYKENKLYIAKCYLAMGKTEVGIDWLQKAEMLNSFEDDKVHNEVKTLLERYKC